MRSKRRSIRPIASAPWQWGAAQAGGRRQVATRQRPQISLEGGSDIAARGCDERIRHHLGLAGNLG
jgi:hypothetical protein